MPLLHTLSFIVKHPLNRKRPLQALGRFAWRQLRSRLMPGPVEFDWIGGTRFYAYRGEGGVTGNIYAGLHEFEDLAFVLHFLKPDDLFLDVGANVGSFTILATSARKARTVAFEPVPATFSRLVANVELNDLAPRVTLVNKAVGASPGFVAFTQTSSLSNHAVAPGEAPKSSVEVRIVTLDVAVTIDRPCLVKIDVEGFESQVLQGAVGTLRNPHVQAILIEMIGNGRRYGFDEAQIPPLMQDYGVSPYSYEPFTRSLNQVSGFQHHERNQIFVRDLPAVRARVAAAEPFRIHDLVV